MTMTRADTDRTPGVTGRHDGGTWPKRRPGRWTAEAIPKAGGRAAVITGANSGIGLETSSVLAARGATVVLGCRDVRRGNQAADQIRSRTGAEPPRVSVVQLDLASLESVRRAAAEISSSFAGLDLLINNAAVMRPPGQRSAEGFELTFVTNHLGHFALTGLLLDRLTGTAGSRIVTVSSIGHRDGIMHFDDLQFDGGYHADDAYA